MSEKNKMHRCKRCNRILSHPESIQRGYGSTCYRIMQTNKDQEKNQFQKEIQFLKCEIKFLKRQLQEIKQKGILLNNFESIERIKQEDFTPEKNKFKMNFNFVIKELKIMFDGDSFDYHKILRPIDSREMIEESPLLFKKAEMAN